MTTIIEVIDTARSPRVYETVDIAGVAWPVYKVCALVVAVIAALIAFVLTGSGEVTMWASALSLTTLWWVGRRT